MADIFSIYEIAVNEDELVKVWETMPMQIAEVYAPEACIAKDAGRTVYLAENRLDSSRVVITCAVGEAIAALRKESDTMDLLVLGCIPKKLMFREYDDRAILMGEYIKGESFGGAVARVGAFSEEEVRNFGIDLCEMVMELYERSLSVDPSTLVARNIIISEGRMKFIEPRGIEYCEDCRKNWGELEIAIGELMNMLLVGNGTGLEPESSPGMKKLLAKCRNKSGKNFENAEALLWALRATSPDEQAKKFGTRGIIAVVAALILAIIGISAARLNGPLRKNVSADFVELGEDGIPGADPFDDGAEGVIRGVSSESGEPAESEADNDK
jgi:hypothetical protein